MEVGWKFHPETISQVKCNAFVDERIEPQPFRTTSCLIVDFSAEKNLAHT